LDPLRVKLRRHARQPGPAARRRPTFAARPKTPPRSVNVLLLDSCPRRSPAIFLTVRAALVVDTCKIDRQSRWVSDMDPYARSCAYPRSERLYGV
jgi:hypothetical protein